MKPRCYQTKAIDAVLARFDSGDQRTLCVIPTGGGKTVVAGMIAKRFLDERRGRILVLCHRDELIRQAAEKFGNITGAECAIEKAGEWSQELRLHGKPPIVVASIQSLNGRLGDGKRVHRFNPSEFGLVWVDEAHHSVAGSWRAIVSYFCQCATTKVLGVTATADRADGEALGQIFQSVAFEYQLSDIVDDGYLVPIRQLSVTIEGLDFSKARTTAGDLNAQDMEAAMMFEEPLHGIVYATIELACGLEQGSLRNLANSDDCTAVVSTLIGENTRRQALIFAVTVAHAERMAEIINRWIPGAATYVDGSMSNENRKARLKAFAEKRIQFLVNCMIATEGFDEPRVEIVVMARPTKSRSLFTQMVGRGTRPAQSIAHQLGTLANAQERRACIENSEKPYLQVLDFVGNTGRHKLISTIDILGDETAPEVLELAKEMVKGTSMDVNDAIEKAEEELERRRREAEKQKRLREEEEERRRQADAARRARLVGSADYAVQDVDGMDAFAPRIQRHSVAPQALNPRHVELFKKAKLTDAEIAALSPQTAKELSREIVRRWKLKLSSYRQSKLLRRSGYSREELHNMSFDGAKAAIEELKANGWKRPGSMI